MDEATMKNAQRILLRFVSDMDAKVRYGLARRAEYFEAVARGEDPKTYRSEFISKLADQVFGWLAKKGEEFAALYPQDRLSTEDLKDILITAHQRLVSRTAARR